MLNKGKHWASCKFEYVDSTSDSTNVRDQGIYSKDTVPH